MRRPHIDYNASKITEIVGILARIIHHVPLNTLLQIYRSLIFPYTLYGIPVWGQAVQRDLKKILTLQKRALRLIFFSNKRSRAIPLFIASNILPVDMLYFETVSTIMHDVFTNSTPNNIRQLFIHSSDDHAHNTRFSSARKFHIQESRLGVKLKTLKIFCFGGLQAANRAIWGRHDFSRRPQERKSPQTLCCNYKTYYEILSPFSTSSWSLT